MSKVKEFKTEKEALVFAQKLNTGDSERYEARPWRVGGSKIRGITTISYCVARPIKAKGIVINYLEYKE